MSYFSPSVPELMIRTAGDGQAAFLRKLAAEINEQNSNQHAQTQAAMKTAAREQVGFNLAGYLDDFSKALSVGPYCRVSPTALMTIRVKCVLCLRRSAICASPGALCTCESCVLAAGHLKQMSSC